MLGTSPLEDLLAITYLSTRCTSLSSEEASLSDWICMWVAEGVKELAIGHLDQNTQFHPILSLLPTLALANLTRNEKANPYIHIEPQGALDSQKDIERKQTIGGLKGSISRLNY